MTTNSNPTIDTSTEEALARNAKPATETQSAFWLPVWTLTLRELTRFFRQRTRIIGALGQPFIFWILFGAGLHGSFQSPDWVPSGVDMSYQEYFFPGVAVMILMFTAIFSTISLIDDRREGFLQAVLVAPVPRSALVVGKLTGGAVLAVLQAVLFLVIGPLLAFVGLAPEISLGWSILDGLAIFGFLVLLAFALTALGYTLAWPMDSTQGFHAIMSVVLMPMWLLSGAFFPSGETGWLAWIIRLNPLTYGVAGLRRLVSPEIEFAISNSLPTLPLCLMVTTLFCGVCVVIATWQTRRTGARDST